VVQQTMVTFKALLDEGGINALRSVPSSGHPIGANEFQLEKTTSMIFAEDGLRESEPLFNLQCVNLAGQGVDWIEVTLEKPPF